MKSFEFKGKQTERKQPAAAVTVQTVPQTVVLCSHSCMEGLHQQHVTKKPLKIVGQSEKLDEDKQPATSNMATVRHQELEGKTSIRLVIAARLADVLVGMALGFSAEFGRNTPTGASWYNRAAWAAIHPTRLTPSSLFLSLSSHPSGSLLLSILSPPLPVWTGTSWLH